ncbi:hypothetical protein [Jatrophihabitans fulvus]
MPSDEPLSDAAALWASVSSRAGLRPRDYDAELVADVRQHLGLPREQAMIAALSKRRVTAGALLDAILIALQPFSRMLVDLLKLYEQVGARSATGDNLRIEYDFSSKHPDLKFDLASFRETVQRWTRVTRSVATADPERLWALASALRPPDGDGARPAVAMPLYDDWQAGRWPEDLPTPPATGLPDLDEVLTDTVNVARRVLAVTRSISADRAELSQADRSDPRVANLLALHNDPWLAEVVSLTHLLASAARQGRLDPSATSSVAHALAAIPREKIFDRRRVKELTDVLGLPVWKFRYELYSAWLLTLIVDALTPDRVAVHVANGRLAFSFAGTHLASIESGLGRLELWAELRHAYATPVGKGRVRAIQPDYTISKPPITDSESAILVVEAKQYRRGRKGNFLDALRDYVGGHPKAAVVLANYGSIPDSVHGNAPSGATALSEVRPGRFHECEKFKEAVRAAIPPPPAAPPATEIPRLSLPVTSPQRAGDVTAVVTLSWTSGGDLDLYLVQQNTGAVACFGTIGLTGPDRLVHLWNDDTSAPGLETAYILAGSGPVEVWVHRFGGSLTMSESGAVVRISHIAEGPFLPLTPTADFYGDWWFAGVLGDDGRLRTHETSEYGPPLIGKSARPDLPSREDDGERS